MNHFSASHVTCAGNAGRGADAVHGHHKRFARRTGLTTSFSTGRIDPGSNAGFACVWIATFTMLLLLSSCTHDQRQAIVSSSSRSPTEPLRRNDEAKGVPRKDWKQGAKRPGPSPANLTQEVGPVKVTGLTPEKNASNAETVIEEMGVRVKLTTTSVSALEERNTIYAGDDVEIKFEINDTTTGAPLSRLSPGVWVDSVRPGTQETCRDKVESFLTGSMTARPEYDLNAFYVLVMNDEASITVVDPLFSYGGTRLLAMISLPSPGEDWVISEDGNRLYVTLPLNNQIAVVDTRNWKAVKFIHVGMQPTRIEMQPDGKYLWISCLSNGSEGQRGVISVIDTDTMGLAVNLPVGRGHHEIVFSEDSRYAYVSNAESASVTVVDVQSLKAITEIPIGRSAGGMVYSGVSKNVYVVDGVGGEVIVIDGHRHVIRTRISDKPGLGTIKTTPDGRYVLVANAKENVVQIIDVAGDSIRQTAHVEPGPSQILFSLTVAYVLSRGSEIIDMITLDSIGGDGPVSVADFTGGHTAFGLEQTPSSADRIALAPSGLAVVVANPLDKSVYYYREGMAAPMGEFSNYGREPRAVMVVDRSLKEPSPGVYRTTVQVDHSGSFVVALLLDVPRILHCFDLDVLDPPGATPVDPSKPIQVVSRISDSKVVIGEPVKLVFTITNTGTGHPVKDLKDVTVLTFNSSNWQQRQWATPVSDGVYEATFVPPAPGAYYAACKIPSQGIRFNDVPIRTIRVTDHALRSVVP